MSDLWQMTAGDLAEAYRSKSTRPSELLRAVNDRIERVNPSLAAITGVDERGSELSAAAADARAASERGALHGIPVAVKEMIAVDSMPYTAQSLTRAGVVAGHDAGVVALLRAQGAMVIGTTRTHELAWGITTQHEALGGTRNPWNPAYIPGGSSGGSAVAVASGMVPLALGTDTACSVRLPAAFTGICGFKPTHGLLSTDGVLPLAPSMDHVGILARAVTDIAVALAALSGGATSAVVQRCGPGTRIGIARLHPGDMIGHAQRAAFATAAGVVHGISIDVDWPHDPGVMEVFRVLQAREALVSHRETLGTWPGRRDDYGSDVRQRLEGAAAIGDADVMSARVELERYRQMWDAALRDADVVLLPAAGSGPSLIEDADFVDIDGRRTALRDAVIPWQASANLIGLPACVVPAGRDAEGLPIGVQVIGRRGEDDRVLAAVALVHTALRDTLPAVPCPTRPCRSPLDAAADDHAIRAWRGRCS